MKTPSLIGSTKYGAPIMIWLLLVMTPMFTSCQRAIPVTQQDRAVLFELNDRNQSLVDAHLMHTTSYSTRTNRLLLPGFTSEEGGNIYRIRYQDRVFVFHQTMYGLFGEVYRIEVFDLQGNLVEKGRFHCGEHHIPITLIRVTSKDDANFPIYGVGLFNTRRPLTEHEKTNGSLFGVDLDPDGDGHYIMPDDAGDMANGAYLTIDYRNSPAYDREHGLEDHVRISIRFFEFEGKDTPPDESIVRRREDIFIECLETDIPFYRFDNDQNGDALPPFEPARS